MLLGLVGALLLALLVTASVFALRYLGEVRDNDDSQRDRARAQTVAEQFALRMDTFTGTKIEDYTKKLDEVLTTKARAQFKDQFTQFAQVAKAGQMKGTGKVLMSAVGDHDPDSATILVVHDSSSSFTAEGAKAPSNTQVLHNRWTVNLAKVKGTWLVDSFVPVG